MPQITDLDKANREATRPMTVAELTAWLHQHGVDPGPDTDRLLTEYAGKSLVEMDEENDRINGRMA